MLDIPLKSVLEGMPRNDRLKELLGPVYLVPVGEGVVN